MDSTINEPLSSERRQKYLESFRKSRSRVLAYEQQFKRLHGRKPDKDDLAKAPQHIVICLKNCKKIQAYFKQKDETLVHSHDDRSQTLDIQESSNIETIVETTRNANTSETAKISDAKLLKTVSQCGDTPNGSVWGSHLNKSNEETCKSGLMKRHKTESAIARTSSFAGFFPEAAMTQSSQQTRISLKKNPKSRKSSAKNFFDTLGGDTENTTLPSPPSPKAKKFVDPLSRFDPEISMSGCDDDQTTEFNFGTLGKVSTKPAESGKRHALSVLSVLSSQSQTEKRLNFSGIFSNCSRMSQEEENVETSGKRQRDDENATTKIDETTSNKVDENASNKIDENSPKNSDENRSPLPKRAKMEIPNNVDPATQQPDKNDIYAIGFEEVDDDERGFKTSKPFFNMGAVKSKNAAGNFVRINLKKKNYVRGKKTMTGSKYRRQEWKRKTAEKQKTAGKKNLKLSDDANDDEMTKPPQDAVDIPTVNKPEIKRKIAAPKKKKGRIENIETQENNENPCQQKPKRQNRKAQIRSESEEDVPMNVDDDSSKDVENKRQQQKRLCRNRIKVLDVESNEDDDDADEDAWIVETSSESNVVEEGTDEIFESTKATCSRRQKSKTAAKPKRVETKPRKPVKKSKAVDIDDEDDPSDIKAKPRKPVKKSKAVDIVDEDEDTEALNAEFEDDDPFGEHEQASLANSVCAAIPGTRFSDKVLPYFTNDATDEDKKKILQQALRKFGHVSFRPSQMEAMMKILSGDSALVVSATGSGKSLIYQLPSFLYGERQRCITLVISPLVSLMEDQVTGLPHFLRAACLHFNQTERQREKVVEEVKSGRLHFLLVSPETIAGGGSLFGRVLQNMPPIAFVCIDEAHCVSQWSHNFRPAYLRLAKVVREKLSVDIVLGLTATAPESTLADVATRLGVCYDTGIIRGPLLPDNLTLTVSKDADRERALIDLVQTEPFVSFNSIIVYCTRREECDRISTLLRMSLADKSEKLSTVSKNGRTRTSITAEAYHAGMTAFRRKTIQKQFMSGQLRIVVATVAFGMGIDKSDIRGIIHYNMPKTFENYVQEIGRAGRDGRPARCHLFLDSDGGSLVLNELRRFIHSNSIDRHTVRKLIDMIFAKTAAKEFDCGGDGKVYQEVALTISDLVQQLDMPEENISTLLCYLENHSKEWVRLLNPVYANCTVRSYKGAQSLDRLVRTCRILSEAAKTNPIKNGEIQFSVVDVSARNGWESAVVKRELKNLVWDTSLAGSTQKSGVIVEFHDLAFHFLALKGLGDDALEEVLDYLYDKTATREKSELASLFRAYRAFSTAAQPKDTGQELQLAKSNKLKEFIREYFQEIDPNPDNRYGSLPSATIDSQMENGLRADVRQFVMTHSDHVWTGRAVARIFHGIPSPNFPAIQWGKVRRFWRAYLQVDFNVVCKVATQEVIKLRSIGR